MTTDISDRLPLTIKPGPEYCEILDAEGKIVGMTTEPEVIKAALASPTFADGLRAAAKIVHGNELLEGRYREWPFFGSGNCSREDYAVRLADAMETAILALAASPASPGDGWRDISTAPKNGTRFWAFDPNREAHHYECWWQNDFIHWEGWQDDWDSEPEPSHWQPLPTPPTPAKEAGE